MTEDNLSPFRDGVRVSHAEKGLGTISRDPGADQLVVSAHQEAQTGADMVYVVWDDARFPVGKVSADALELVPPAAVAISTGV